MNYLFLAVITTFFSLPSIAYEQKTQQPNIVLQQAITAVFPEVLERIAICESHNQQFNENGKVLRGGYNKHDIGKYQINDLYWGDYAKDLGLDIYSEEGNEALALAIYEKYGTAPWNWSKKCWNA
jgi:hypothetical protein